MLSVALETAHITARSTGAGHTKLIRASVQPTEERPQLNVRGVSVAEGVVEGVRLVETEGEGGDVSEATLLRVLREEGVGFAVAVAQREECREWDGAGLLLRLLFCSCCCCCCCYCCY